MSVYLGGVFNIINSLIPYWPLTLNVGETRDSRNTVCINARGVVMSPQVAAPLFPYGGVLVPHRTIINRSVVYC